MSGEAQKTKQPKKNKSFFRKDGVWAFSTYFAEGFPFIIIRNLSTFFFRDMKVSHELIGLSTSFFSLPWILKFLWGPWVDEYSNKRRWMLSMQMGLFFMMVLAALLFPLKDGVLLIAILFFIGAFLSATNDISIDGYYMVMLDKAGQAKFLGYRVMAYRVAMLTGTAGISRIAAYQGWYWAFVTSFIIFGLVLFFHLFFLKEDAPPKKKITELFSRAFHGNSLFYGMGGILVIASVYLFFTSKYYKEVQGKIPMLAKIDFATGVTVLLFLALVVLALSRKKITAFITRDPDSYYGKAFLSFMAQEKIGAILAFIILLRAGEFTLSTMINPFIVDLGLKMHYWWLTGFVGLPATILGAMLGGWMISKFSLKKLAFPFILAQNVTNIIYALLAFHLAGFITLNAGGEHISSVGLFNIILVAITHGFDQFSGGLGTAVLMTYLMRICHKDYKASHFAIGSALMGLSNPFVSALSGHIVHAWGYATLFGMSFVFSIPGMILIPFLPYLSDNSRYGEA